MGDYIKRTQGSVRANPVIELLHEEAAKITDPDGVRGFWDNVRRAVDATIGPPEAAATPPPLVIRRLVPMTDAEVLEMVDLRMLFGKYAGERIGNVLQHHPDYLRWFVSHSQGMYLLRFMANPSVASRLWGPNAVGDTEDYLEDEAQREE